MIFRYVFILYTGRSLRRSYIHCLTNLDIELLAFSCTAGLLLIGYTCFRITAPSSSLYLTLFALRRCNFQSPWKIRQLFHNAFFKHIENFSFVLSYDRIANAIMKCVFWIVRSIIHTNIETLRIGSTITLGHIFSENWIRYIVWNHVVDLYSVHYEN